MCTDPLTVFYKDAVHGVLDFGRSTCRDLTKEVNLLYAFFWVITRRLEFICTRFGTLRLFHLHRQVDVSRIN